MFYVIPETWLKVALNTNKTGQHVIRYTEHIVESVDKHMVTSFIGVKRHFQQYVRYNVEHGDQFYWCLMPLSTMLVIV
jgi:hypothetical protein